MLLNYFSLTLVLLLSFFNYLIPQPIAGNLIDCERASVTISTKQIDEYSAEDFYILGVCEYENHNFNKAYNYFISAKSLGFADEQTLQNYLNDSRNELTKLEVKDELNLEKEDEVAINNYKHKVQVYLLNIIFVLIAFIGLITAFTLIYKYRNVVNNIYLGIFLFAISLALIELVLYWQDFFSYSPTVSIYRILFFLWAPSLYLYVKTKYSDTHISRKEIVLHYLPFFLVLVSLLIFGNFYDTINAENNIFLNALDFVMNDNWIKTIHLSAYLMLIILDFELKRKELDQGFKKWMLTLIGFIIILILFIIARAAFEHIYVFDYISKYFIAVYLILFISVLEVLLIIQPNIILGTINLEEKNKLNNKYKNSSLTENMSLRVKDQLLDSLNIDKVYLDNTLTLSKLAKKINVDRYSLSQVINQELNKNFYELINDFRIAEAVKIIETDNNKQVIDLIYECGFNNKVSFYKAFKQRMHMTPKDFIENRKK
ncbi:AraC family transcriptional regulator [uncultured Maribacter sp.]|uniref:helix-turn-helix domain-containing protein n=1 Tax=uncultured Maribacter sp. TaxID=431308 RepID=UPI00260617B3|nr:helix-turn-helix domain-containing protein [uncultured Maribacter sp.]